MSDVGAEIGDHAARRGEHTGVLEIELCLVEGGASRLDLCVVVTGLAGSGQCRSQLRLASANLAARLLARRLRHLEAAHRDRAGILLVQPLLALGVALRHVAIGFGRLEPRPCSLDTGLGCVDGVARDGVARAGALKSDLVWLGIDVEQWLTDLHFLVVADVDLDDVARHFGGDRHHECLDARLGRARRQPIADDVQDEARHDEHGEDNGALAATAARVGIDRLGTRRISGVVHGVSVGGCGWGSSGAGGSGASCRPFHLLRSPIVALVAGSTMGRSRPACQPPPMAL